MKLIFNEIGNHQTITFSIRKVKAIKTLEKNKSNFRRANFDAMRIIFEQPIVRNNAELGFEILKSRVNDQSPVFADGSCGF